MIGKTKKQSKANNTLPLMMIFVTLLAFLPFALIFIASFTDETALIR